MDKIPDRLAADLAATPPAAIPDDGASAAARHNERATMHHDAPTVADIEGPPTLKSQFEHLLHHADDSITLAWDNEDRTHDAGDPDYLINLQDTMDSIHPVRDAIAAAFATLANLSDLIDRYANDRGFSASDYHDTLDDAKKDIDDAIDRWHDPAHESNAAHPILVLIEHGQVWQIRGIGDRPWETIDIDGPDNTISPAAFEMLDREEAAVWTFNVR